MSAIQAALEAQARDQNESHINTGSQPVTNVNPDSVSTEPYDNDNSRATSRRRLDTAGRADEFPPVPNESDDEINENTVDNNNQQIQLMDMNVLNEPAVDTVLSLADPQTFINDDNLWAQWIRHMDERFMHYENRFQYSQATMNNFFTVNNYMLQLGVSGTYLQSVLQNYENLANAMVTAQSQIESLRNAVLDRNTVLQMGVIDRQAMSEQIQLHMADISAANEHINSMYDVFQDLNRILVQTQNELNRTRATNVQLQNQMAAQNTQHQVHLAQAQAEVSRVEAQRVQEQETQNVLLQGRMAVTQAEHRAELNRQQQEAERANIEHQAAAQIQQIQCKRETDELIAQNAAYKAQAEAELKVKQEEIDKMNERKGVLLNVEE